METILGMLQFLSNENASYHWSDLLIKRIQAMYKSILFHLDGSAMAEQALPYAVAQAVHF